MCGVVEGFYGRPWTLDQRKDLFGKMQAKKFEMFIIVVRLVLFLRKEASIEQIACSVSKDPFTNLASVHTKII